MPTSRPTAENGVYQEQSGCSIDVCYDVPEARALLLVRQGNRLALPDDADAVTSHLISAV